jgi:hypothetical protein
VLSKSFIEPHVIDAGQAINPASHNNGVHSLKLPVVAIQIILLLLCEHFLSFQFELQGFKDIISIGVVPKEVKNTACFINKANSEQETRHTKDSDVAEVTIRPVHSGL